jgi:tripeptide aminopeptidase
MNDEIARRVTEEFCTIVKIDSLSLREEKMFEYLHRRVEKLPVQAQFLPYELEETGSRSGNFVVKLPANTTGRRSVFFDAHVDTVEPGMGIRPVVRDGVITSEGNTILGSDDKAGVAAMLIALEDLVKTGAPHGDVTFVFTSAEEIGLLGASKLDIRAVKSDFGFILDSHGSVGGVVTAAPTQYKYRISVRGKAAHAGIEPEQGISAIRIAAKIISKLPQGRINGNTVSNVGVVEGGKATNIIPDECIIEGEFRSHSVADIAGLVRRVTGTVERYRREAVGIDLELNEMYPGFSYGADAPILSVAGEAIRSLGIEPRFERTGGGSNTNIYNAHGEPSVTLAVGMTKVHSTEESIRVQDLTDLVRLIVRIVETV